MMKHKKLLYGILVVAIAIMGIGLFMYLSKPTPTPESEVTLTPEGQIIVKQSGGAWMLIEECADKSYITETADYIIEGTVEKVESRWSEERTSIFTYTDLVIEEYVKGTPFTEDKLQIVTSGGTVGEISQWVEDQPIFHEGKKVRIYFQKTNGEFSIVCAQMGVEEIVNQTCDQKCKSLSYIAGTCRSWSAGLHPKYEVEKCKEDEVNIGYTEDCYIEHGFVGGDKGCCCRK